VDDHAYKFGIGVFEISIFIPIVLHLAVGNQ